MSIPEKVDFHKKKGANLSTPMRLHLHPKEGDNHMLVYVDNKTVGAPTIHDEGSPPVNIHHNPAKIANRGKIERIFMEEKIP